MEAQEEPVEPEQDHGHRERGDAERGERAYEEAAGDDRTPPRRAAEADREPDQDHEHAELAAERHSEPLAHVAHVAQLALGEGGAPVRQLRALEQHDAFARREDRVEPREREPRRRCGVVSP